MPDARVANASRPPLAATSRIRVHARVETVDGVAPDRCAARGPSPSQPKIDVAAAAVCTERETVELGKPEPHTNVTVDDRVHHVEHLVAVEVARSVPRLAASLRRRGCRDAGLRSAGARSRIGIGQLRRETRLGLAGHVVPPSSPRPVGGALDRVEERGAHAVGLEHLRDRQRSCHPATSPRRGAISGLSPVLGEQGRRTEECLAHELRAAVARGSPTSTPASIIASANEEHVRRSRARQPGDGVELRLRHADDGADRTQHTFGELEIASRSTCARPRSRLHPSRRARRCWAWPARPAARRHAASSAAIVTPAAIDSTSASLGQDLGRSFERADRRRPASPR